MDIQTLTEQLAFLKNKHEKAGNDLQKISELISRDGFSKGTVAALLVTYRNNLDTLKQETADTIKLLQTERN